METAEVLESLVTREDFMVGFSDNSDDKYKCFSNFCEAPFYLAGKDYLSTEQYMMYQKAITFRRYESSREIMRVQSAEEAMEIADKNHMPLKPSEIEIWDSISRAIVKRGVRAKFLQNPEFISVLLATGNKVIAKCDEKDKIWGIGIDIKDPARLDADAWKGDNVLGRILMELRTEFRFNMITNPSLAISFNDAMSEKPIAEWDLKAGELKRHPAYYNTIHAYSDTFITPEAKEAFYNTTLSDVEIVISTNLGGGYPVAGFYELKQDVYDISFYLNKYLG